MAALRDAPHQIVGSDLHAPWTGPQASSDIAVGVAGRQISRRVRVGYGPLLDDEGVLGLPVWWEDAEHCCVPFEGGRDVPLTSAPKHRGHPVEAARSRPKAGGGTLS